MIKELKKRKDIENVLIMFSPYLQTLSSGSVDKKSFSKKLSDFGKVIVMEENENVIGFAAFYCNDFKSKEAYLSYIAVKKEFLKCGYGKRIMESVILRARLAGMHSLKLEVRKDNDIAIAFYKHLKFQKISQETDHSIFMKCEI